VSIAIFLADFVSGSCTGGIASPEINAKFQGLQQAEFETAWIMVAQAV